MVTKSIGRCEIACYLHTLGRLSCTTIVLLDAHQLRQLAHSAGPLRQKNVDTPVNSLISMIKPLLLNIALLCNAAQGHDFHNTKFGLKAARQNDAV